MKPEGDSVSNGRFVTWITVVSALLTISGGLSIWVWNLTRDLNTSQGLQIRQNAELLAQRGERIAVMEGRMQILEFRVLNVEKRCAPAGVP